MARSKRALKALEDAVREQIVACRTLAEALRGNAQSRRLLEVGTRRLIEGWASQVDHIAEELESALAENQPAGMLTWSNLAKCVAAPILVAGSAAAAEVGKEAGQAVVEYVFGSDQEVIDAAQAVDEQAGNVVAYIEASPSLVLEPVVIELPPTYRDQDQSEISFPRTLRTIRGRLRLTQQEVAVLVGVSQPAVSNWECGYTRPRNRQAIVDGLSELLGDRPSLREQLAMSLGVDLGPNR